MEKPSASVRSLAEHMLAFEAAANDASHAHEAVWHKLCGSLTRFAGSEESSSLLRRALSLARAEVPALKDVTLRADGSLDGLDPHAIDSISGGPEGVSAITAHLLWLLVTFVGEALTLRLVRESWPDASMGDEQSGNEAVP